MNSDESKETFQRFHIKLGLGLGMLVGYALGAGTIVVGDFFKLNKEEIELVKSPHESSTKSDSTKVNVLGYKNI